MEDIRPDSGHTLHLLNQVQTGDREALGQLLKRHRPKLERAVAHGSIAVFVPAWTPQTSCRKPSSKPRSGLTISWQSAPCRFTSG